MGRPNDPSFPHSVSCTTIFVAGCLRMCVIALKQSFCVLWETVDWLLDDVT